MVPRLVGAMRTAHRLGVTALVFALAATACSKSEESAPTTATTTGVPRSTTTTATVEVPTPVIPTFAGDAEMIGVDDAVRIGVLENGLTYYIQKSYSRGIGYLGSYWWFSYICSNP